MLQKTGTAADRLCTGCAVLFCCVILLQNLLALPHLRPPVILAGLALGVGVLWLCLRCLTPAKHFGVILFVLRFALALCFILWLNSQPVQDFNTMYTAAGQLARGDHAYLDNVYFFNWAYQSAFTAYEAVVIALFGQSPLPLQLLNAAYLAGTNLMVYLIARKLVSQRAAMTAGVLYALYPAPLFLAGVLTNQHLSVFLFYTAVYLLLRTPRPCLPRWLGAGALIALGNAMRPIGVILLLAAGIWSVICWLRSGHIRWLLSGMSAAASYILLGALLSGIIVWSGINPQGLANNQPMWKFVVGLNQDSSGHWNEADYETYLDPSLTQTEANEAMTQEVLERLSVGPVKLAGLAWRKSAAMWAGSEDLYWGFGHHDQSAPAVPLPLSWNTTQLLFGDLDKGIYLLAFALALYALVRRLRDKAPDPAPLLLTLLLCGYYAVHLIVEVQVRYRYFLMPCVFLLAACALDHLPTSRKKT